MKVAVATTKEAIKVLVFVFIDVSSPIPVNPGAVSAYRWQFAISGSGETKN